MEKYIALKSGEKFLLVGTSDGNFSGYEEYPETAEHPGGLYPLTISETHCLQKAVCPENLTYSEVFATLEGGRHYPLHAEGTL